MHTDKQVYQLFKYCPEAIFEFAELKAKGPFRLESISVKALERITDGLVLSEDASEPITVIEVQFQRDSSIYNRLVLTMAQIQLTHDLRPVRGIIFFAERALDPRVAPWADAIQAVYLDEVLAHREARDPNDPIVAVFKPVLEQDSAALEMHAARYYRNIQSSQLTGSQIAALSEVFISWLLERLQDRTAQDLAMILDLPSIKDTRAGKEIYEEGIEKGIEKGIGKGRDEGLEEAVITILESRFSAPLDEGLTTSIKDLPITTLRQFLRECLTVASLTEAEERIRELGKQD